MTRTRSERAAYAARIYAYEATPVWKVRRDRFIDRHGRFCDACGITTRLHVHHRSYANAFHGRERDKDLRVLCSDHHQIVHDVAHHGVPLAQATDRVIGRGYRVQRSWWRVLWRLMRGF